MIHSLGEAELHWNGRSELPAVHDSFGDVAVCAIRNHLTNSNTGHPFRYQDEQERLNQLRNDLYVPLRQFKTFNHFQGHRKAGISVYVERELGILETT